MDLTDIPETYSCRTSLLPAITMGMFFLFIS
jgi:hypothetical protein